MLLPMKNQISTLILLMTLVAPCILLGQYPSNIHNEDLRVWLKTNVYDGNFSDIGYDSAREEMYSFTDEVNGKISCIYTDFEQNAEFTTFLNPINAEHIVPQSFYGSTSPMRSDIHNIRPAHGSANSARSFFDFGNVPDGQATWYGVDSGGNYQSLNSEPSSSADFSEGISGLWEPQEDRKGDVARQMFYFYTMYPTQAGPITDLASVSTLYEWHLNDPVDALELQRNDRIEITQGNRNPYIDYADLAFDAWLWVEILGCTDASAINFDSEANTDDGSCILGIAGCTDPDFIEFDPEATLDIGSCVTLKVFGCRYPNALNYNPLANIDDDGGCVFGDICLGDLNNSNSVTAVDLTIFLSLFGLPCED